MSQRETRGFRSEGTQEIERLESRKLTYRCAVLEGEALQGVSFLDFMSDHCSDASVRGCSLHVVAGATVALEGPVNASDTLTFVRRSVRHLSSACPARRRWTSPVARKTHCFRHHWWDRDVVKSCMLIGPYFTCFSIHQSCWRIVLVVL